MELKTEIWKDIIDYIGLYQISNYGNVRSLKKILNGTPHFIKKYISNRGYYTVKLWKLGKSNYKTIHKLVAQMFINHIPCGYILVINHIDGCKTNNNLNNLEIVTNRYNTADGINRLGCTSEYHGVCLNKKNKKYQASIQVDKKNYYLGTFIFEKDASNIYNDAIYNLENNNFYNWIKTININVNKTSKYMGVSYIKKTNKWKSRIERNGITKHLGYFEDEISAYNAYVYAKKNIKRTELGSDT